MPFLHWETVKSLTKRHQAIDALKFEQLPTVAKEPYMRLKYEPPNPSIVSDHLVQLPLALDQYRYPTVSLNSGRFEAQPLAKLTAKSDTGSKLLTVHQLWLVVPNCGWFLYQ